MAGTVKKLQFSEGTDVGAPTDLSLATSTTTISEYVDDAAYVTANGTASAGDVYINSTSKVLRYYTGSAWRNAVPAMDPTDATKTFLIDVSGNTANMSATLSFGATGNRVYTFPDVSITVASRAGTETLTNKTLTAPLITTNGSIDVTGAGTLAIGASVGANNLTLGGASSTVVVAGNLQVSGTTTTVNSTTLDVADKNITVSKGGNDAASEGSGLTVDRTGTKGSFIYKDASASKFACGPLGSELDIVTTTATQSISNKTITASDHDGGTASNSSRITLPKDTKSNLDALTRKAGTIVYATDLAKPYYDDGSILKEVGSGSGSGGINYITNGTFEDNNVTGWATYADAAATSPVDGTGGSPVSTFASTASSPLRGTYSGLLTKGAANRQGEGFSYAFTIASADKSRPLLITWEGSASANYTGSSGSEYLSVYVYDVTNATLITPASTTVAPGVSKGSTFFVATTSTSYRLIFHVAGTGTSSWTYTIDTVSVGPQSIGVGAAVTDWQSYSLSVTGTGSNPTFGTNSSNAKYRRVGNQIEIVYQYTQSAAGTNGSGTWRFSLPSGLDLDTSALSNTLSTIGSVGSFYSFNGTTEVYAGSIYFVAGDGTTRFRLISSTGELGSANFSYGSTTLALSFRATLPIAQWSSSSFQTADRAVEEYAYNTSTATTGSDTTSFGYGPAGVQIYSLTTAGNRRVRFQNPIQATDSLRLEVQLSGGNWIPLTNQDSVTGLSPYLIQNTTEYGMGINATVINSTDVDVHFGLYSYPAGATYGSAGSGWSGFTNYKWRVRKVSGGATVGYPVSSQNVVGRTDGVAPSAGYVGQVISATLAAGSAVALTTATAKTVTSISLTPGSWLIVGGINLQQTSGTATVTEFTLGVSKTNNAYGSGQTVPVSGECYYFYDASLALNVANQYRAMPILPYTYNSTSTETLYLVTNCTFSGGNVSANGYIQAVRIA